MVIRRPMGVCAAITPVQLPADAARDEGRAGAGVRQHGRGQARVDDAARDPAGRQAVRRGRRARRRPERRDRPRARTSATRSSATPTSGASRSPARPTVGRHVAKLAAPDLKRLTLELGGTDPVIICADADVDAAVKAVIIGRYWNAGQACLGCKRVFVHDSVYDGFVSQLVERVGRYEPGDGTVKAEKPKLRMGPIHTRAGPRRAARADRGRRRQGRRAADRRRDRRQRQGLVPRAGGDRRARRHIAPHARRSVRAGPPGLEVHRLRRRDRPRERHASTASGRASGPTTRA